MKTLFKQILAALLFAVALSACSSLGVNPQTFDDKIAAASVTVTSATLAADQLAASGKITKAQAQSALASSRAGSLALDTAQALKAKGDAAGAEAQLAMANTVLSAVKTFLISQGATVK